MHIAPNRIDLGLMRTALRARGVADSTVDPVLDLTKSFFVFSLRRENYWISSEETGLRQHGEV